MGRQVPDHEFRVSSILLLHAPLLIRVVSSCLSAIEFRSFRNYVNPARASPLDYCVREYPSSRPRFHLHTADHQPAICVSTILCKESKVMEPSSRGVRHKYILGVHHSQEYERNVGFHCTTFEHEVLHSQMGMDSIQFATKADFSQRGEFLHFDWLTPS